MDFAKVKEIAALEGSMVKVMCETQVLWEKNIGLPKEYQEVEWIRAEANVKAYIDLGFSYDSGATINLGQWIMNDNTAYPFGATENSGALRCCFSSPYSGLIYIYGSKGSVHINIQTDYVLDVLNDIKATYKAGAFAAENKAANDKAGPASALVDYTMTNNLYLFAQNYNGSPRFGGIRQISYFRYYDKNDELICDLVPCYRKSDGEIGMYDLARKIFLTNVGTGTFTKGPEISVGGGNT